jgi:hypothetical protein
LNPLIEFDFIFHESYLAFSAVLREPVREGGEAKAYVLEMRPSGVLIRF